MEKVIKITESEIIEGFKEVDKNRERGNKIRPIKGKWTRGKWGTTLFEFEIIQIEKDNGRIIMGLRQIKKDKNGNTVVATLEFKEKEAKKLRKELGITEKKEWIETIYRKGRENEPHIWF